MDYDRLGRAVKNAVPIVLFAMAFSNTVERHGLAQAILVWGIILVLIIAAWKS